VTALLTLAFSWPLGLLAALVADRVLRIREERETAAAARAGKRSHVTHNDPARSPSPVQEGSAGRTPADEEGVRRPELSIVVVARDEERALPDLLADLASQRLENLVTEVLLVDDRSRDRSRALMDSFRPDTLRVRVLGWPDSTGKPDCLKRAVPLCRGRYVLFTDADCRLNPGWAAGLVEILRREADLASAPVLLAEGATAAGPHLLWQRLQWLAISGTAALFSRAGRPISAFGANLGFRREVLEGCGGYTQLVRVSSGEDLALFKALRERGARFVFRAADPELTVRTAPESAASTGLQLGRWVRSVHRLPPSGLLPILWAAAANCSLPLLLFWSWPLGLAWLALSTWLLALLLRSYASGMRVPGPSLAEALLYWLCWPPLVVRAAWSSWRGLRDWRKQ